MTVSQLPEFPLVCLQTADSLTTTEVIRGKNTVIDVWTTKCTQCPDALDELNRMAEQYPQVQFVSICCDQLDGAREILEKPKEPRWSSIQHYFMNQEHKEQAKRILGFRQVPFYVVLNAEGDIVQMGSSRTVDFHRIPGIHLNDLEEEGKAEVAELKDECADNKENVVPPSFKECKKAVSTENHPVLAERVFAIDDLDF